MAVDIFLKLSNNIRGESQDATYKDNIDVLAWSWGMSQSGTTHMGPGGGGGKVSVQDLSINKYVDLSSNDLIKVVPGLMIWTLIAFAITFFVLKRYAFGPIQKTIDDRRDRIRQAVEEIWGDVDVVDVRTLSVKSKPKRRGYTKGRTRSWKKAIVQVAPGQSIPIFQALDGLAEGEE